MLDRLLWMLVGALIEKALGLTFGRPVFWTIALLSGAVGLAAMGGAGPLAGRDSRMADASFGILLGAVLDLGVSAARRWMAEGKGTDEDEERAARALRASCGLIVLRVPLFVTFYAAAFRFGYGLRTDFPWTEAKWIIAFELITGVLLARSMAGEVGAGRLVGVAVVGVLWLLIGALRILPLYAIVGWIWVDNFDPPWLLAFAAFYIGVAMRHSPASMEFAALPYSLPQKADREKSKAIGGEHDGDTPSPSPLKRS